MVDAVFANDAACDAATCGLREAVALERNWHFGNEHFVLHGTLQQLLQQLSANLDVRTGHVVDLIDHSSSDQIRVVLRDGRVVVCSHVVVTVPLPILRDGVLKFSPPLPPAKLAKFHFLALFYLF